MTLDHFKQIWLLDFEFHQPPGERPDPICLVATEHRSGATMRLGPDDLRRHTRPPFPTGPDVVVVAYYAAAEMGCFLALGWPLPAHVIDLYAEFSVITNGLLRPAAACSGRWFTSG